MDRRLGGLEAWRLEKLSRAVNLTREARKEFLRLISTVTVYSRDYLRENLLVGSVVEFIL